MTVPGRTSIRLLSRGDEAALDAFLRRHTDSSMFLRSNARAADLQYRGEPLQATYVAALNGGAITAVAAHCWNSILLVQAPERLDEVVRAAVERSGRPVAGLSGPAPHVAAARRTLGLDGAPVVKDSVEHLFALPLADLVVPPPLASGALVCRHPRRDEIELLVAWRVAFAIEALGFADSPTLNHEARADIARHQEHGSHWILLDGGKPVSYSAFNARLPDTVQIGGVWTPPELRGRGYARAVVAGSLLETRAQGATRAVLFADNPAARRAYEAIGFHPVGEYGLILFRDPVAVPILKGGLGETQP